MANLIRVKDTRYQNQCASCGKIIAAHSQSLWDKENGKNYHPGCEPASSRPQANPISGNSKNAHGEAPQADEPSNSKRVEARLRNAKSIVDKVFPEASGYADYLNLVNESFRQLQSESWLELEKAKAKLRN